MKAQPLHLAPTTSTDDASWQLFSHTEPVWEAIYRDCEQAKHSIECEIYILEKDPLGERFMRLFIDKAKAGLRIFLICDAFGSMLLYSSPMVTELRAAGGEIHFYNSNRGWRFFTPWRWFPRNHCKTFLIDSKIAYTGGVCIAERMKEWRDTHMRITGDVVQQLCKSFDHLGSRIPKRPMDDINPAPNDPRFTFLLHRPLHKRHAVYQELIKAVKEANHYIYITSSYFVPNRRFITALKHAHQRGVDVKVLVPEHSDVVMADWIRLSYTRRYLASGMQMFHYTKSMLHSKTAIIDDAWGTVGSTNFDVISFFYNREANLMIADKEVIAELKHQFNADLRDSVPFTWQDWRTIPAWKKAAGYATRLLKAFFE